MLKLTEKALDNALAAVELHGYGSFFPDPPEMAVLNNSWPEIRLALSQLDLDTYQGYEPVVSFAPKSRLNVRRVALLHPYDLVLFTALTLELRDGISSARIPVADNRVFSYRGEGVSEGALYATTGVRGYLEFR